MLIAVASNTNYDDAWWALVVGLKCSVTSLFTVAIKFIH